MKLAILGLSGLLLSTVAMATGRACPGAAEVPDIRLTSYTAAISAAILNCMGTDGLTATNPFLGKFQNDIASAFAATDKFYIRVAGDKHKTDAMQTRTQNLVSSGDRQAICAGLPVLIQNLNQLESRADLDTLIQSQALFRLVEFKDCGL